MFLEFFSMLSDSIFYTFNLLGILPPRLPCINNCPAFYELTYLLMRAFLNCEIN